MSGPALEQAAGGLVQELPPKEGFSSVLYKRHLPKRGPPGWVLLAGVAFVMAVGTELRARGIRLRR